MTARARPNKTQATEKTDFELRLQRADDDLRKIAAAVDIGEIPDIPDGEPLHFNMEHMPKPSSPKTEKSIKRREKTSESSSRSRREKSVERKKRSEKSSDRKEHKKDRKKRSNSSSRRKSSSDRH